MRVRIYTCIGAGPEPDVKTVIHSIEAALGAAKCTAGNLKGRGIVTKEFLESLRREESADLMKLDDLVKTHSTFLVSEDHHSTWVVFNYVSMRTRNQRTLEGTLRMGGLYPSRRFDSFTVDDFTLLSICVQLERGLIFVLVNVGLPPQQTIDDLSLSVSRAVGRQAAASPLNLSESDYNGTAGQLKDVYEVTEFGGNLESGTFEVKDPRNIFANSKIEKADNALEIRASIDDGRWRKIEFRVADFGYYLGMSKSPQGGITMWPLVSDWMDKEMALSAFRHIFAVMSRAVDLKRPVQVAIA